VARVAISCEAGNSVALTAPGADRTLPRVERGKQALTAERFAQGMTFDEYVAYAGSAGNLAREAGWWLGRQRHDFSGLLRERYERARLDEAQAAAIRWLAARPDGPAKLLVISEEWSSDCRRDVPMLARLAEAGGLDLRIFQRDGQKVGRGPRSDPAESPNADIVNAFLNEKDGQTFQSVPTAVFLTRELDEIYRYIELPAIYHKERLAAAMQAAARGETREQAWDQFIRDWGALQALPFYQMWASAAVDEMLSALHERVVVATGSAS
jgi:thiol-disulfide isomerase/thioredoxin